MDDFSAKPGVPNAYGLIGNQRNAIALKSACPMTPTIVLKIMMSLVTDSGSRIITTVTQIISNVVDHQMNIAEASHAARFHHQWFPDELRIEPNGFSNDTLKKLREKGHTIQTKRVMGSTQSVETKWRIVWRIRPTDTVWLNVGLLINEQRVLVAYHKGFSSLNKP